jgi:hypothetical protein
MELGAIFFPSATDWLSPTQWSRTIAAAPTTRIFTSSYASDRNLDFPLASVGRPSMPSYPRSAFDRMVSLQTRG